MSARPWRQRVLLGLLALTLIVSAASQANWKSADEAVPALPVPPKHRPAVSAQPVQQQSQPQPRIELERLQRRDSPADTSEVASTQAFGAMSWYVPPPPKPAPKPAPTPPPTAPPMPFSFMGRYEEGAGRTFLLVRGERIYTVSEGEVIDNTYRVGRLLGGQLELTYLPLNIKQTLSAEGP